MEKQKKLAVFKQIFRHIFFAFLSLILLTSVIILHVKPEQGEKNFAAVVPHHDIVAKERLQFLSQNFSEVSPTVLVIISPNHYSVGEQIQVANQAWTSKNGTLPNNSPLQAQLASVATVSSDNFTNEHGIRNIIADALQVFGPIPTTAIMIRNDTRKEALDKVAEVLAQNCNKCILIASVDFSHYQPAFISDAHDAHTLKVLESGDISAYDTLEVDSWQSLYLTAQWAKKKGLSYFSRSLRTSSDDMIQQPLAEGTTHFFGSWQTRHVHTATEVNLTIAKLPAPLGIDWPGHTSFRTIFGTDSTFLASGVSKKPGVINQTLPIRTNEILLSNTIEIQPDRTINVLFLETADATESYAEAEKAFKEGYNLVIADSQPDWIKSEQGLYVGSLAMDGYTISLIARFEAERMVVEPFFLSKMQGESFLELNPDTINKLKDAIHYR